MGSDDMRFDPVPNMDEDETSMPHLSDDDDDAEPPSVNRGKVFRAALFLALPILSVFGTQEAFPAVLALGCVGFTIDGLSVFRIKNRFMSLFVCITFLQTLVILYYDTGGPRRTVAEKGGFRVVTPDAVDKSITDMPWKGGAGLSVIITAHQESLVHLKKTIESIVATTNAEVLQDIVVVDDASSVVVTIAAMDLNAASVSVVRIVRNPTRQGVVRSKIIGAAAATGIVYMFMDAHMKPEVGWLSPILRLINTNYKRIVSPVLVNLNPDTWVNDVTATSSKMLFDWNFDLQWVDDLNDEVPVMSGGVFAVSKDWWENLGGYDQGFTEYGMENLEMSLRTWLCGGEIMLASESLIGHVFKEQFPYTVSEEALAMNKLRAVELWVDEEHKDPFYENHKEFRDGKNDFDFSTVDVIKKNLACQPFMSFVNRFYDVFQMHRLLPLPVYTISIGKKHCLDHEDGNLEVKACTGSERQEWAWIYGNGLYHPTLKRCIGIDNGKPGMPSLVRCKKGDSKQQWSLRNGHLLWGSWCLEVKGENATSGPVEFRTCGVQSAHWNMDVI